METLIGLLWRLVDPRAWPEARSVAITPPVTFGVSALLVVFVIFTLKVASVTLGRTGRPVIR
jgi:hypothetical protein